jgi:hypothetical protein
MKVVGRRLLLLIVAGVSGGAISTAADRPPFSITIGSPQDTWKVGSNVAITIDIVNTSGQRALFRKAPGQEEGELFMDVEVKDDLGRPLPRKPMGELISGGSVQKKFLKPGEALKDGIVVSKLFDLSRIGKYAIRVQRRDEGTNSVVTSNTITVTVSD